jgi:TRAP-type C4-dicarboxylate transport system permease small subunit
MSEETTPSPDSLMANTPTSPNDTIGSDDETSVMKHAVSEFVSARMELAAIEAKEAAEFTVRKIVSAVTLALCLFFVWALLLAGVTGLLANWAQRQLSPHIPGVPGWVIILFALAILHALVGIILIMILKKKPVAPLFELTRQEIENDKAWAKNKK